MSITKHPYGTTADGTAVDRYTLANADGLSVCIITFGGIIARLDVPDRNGRMADIVLGYDSLATYEQNPSYMGAIIGRFANRISGGRFVLEGKQHVLAQNADGNHLHGGNKGFDKVVWSARELVDGDGVELRHSSPDGDEGYPGTLNARVTYRLTDDNALRIGYEATTDKPTILNLTSHSYFNLAGAGSGDILGHELTINATCFTAVDAASIPTGELRAVAGTPLDFTVPTSIGSRIDADDEQLRFGSGYDHNYVLNPVAGQETPAARVVEPLSGRAMDVLTTEPGVQFYTGNFLDPVPLGKGGKAYGRRHGFCLETQHYPDSPNKPAFPPVVLNPGEAFRSTTVFRFSTV
jgi:aldose 1-epimerase